MHPNAHDAISEITSSLSWGDCCDYGQIEGLEHNKGSIFLSPTLKYNTLENLQRLIGMFLQQNFIPLEHALEISENKDRMVLTCMACGNHNNKTLKIKPDDTVGKNLKYKIKCLKCEQVTYKTHCFKYGCSYNQIYKNGPKWTYHRTRAEEIYNIVCPRCGAFFIK